MSNEAISNPFQEVTVGQSIDMPAKIVVYGVPKIGKSRFAAQAEDVFFLDIEGGLSYLERKVRATPKLTEFDAVIGWLKHIYDNDNFKAGTIALDSLDWLEKLAQEKLVKAEGAKSIVDPRVTAFAYHKGVEMAADDTMKALRWLDAIYKKKGIKAILIAHSEVKSVDLPNQDAYSRYQLKLSKYLSAKTLEWCDLALFADYSFHVTKDGKTSDPKPMFRAGGSAAFMGGGRMLLDKELPLDYKQLNLHITQPKKGA
jgi:hypothetical protein